MPPEARVIILEDHATFRNIMKKDLEAHGHTVIGEAGTLEEFETLMGQPDIAEASQKYELVVLLDNEVPYTAGQTAEGYGSGAEDIVHETIGTSAITVATTTRKDPGYGEHHWKGKGEFPILLGEFVTALPSKAEQA
jgi:CheY-like chemotaxis protein